MKKIEIEEIKRLASTLMFELNDGELYALSENSTNFLNQVDFVQSIDTDGIEPMCYPFEDVKTYLREDEVTHTITQEEAFKNAPKTEGDYFEIVQVIEK